MPIDKSSVWDSLDIPYYVEEVNDTSQKDKEDEDGKKGSSSQSGSPIPDWVIEERVRFSNWKYIPEKEILINIKIQKQIMLANLNSSFIILSLLQSLKLKPELELDNFIIELEKACFIKYKKSLNQVLYDHLDYAILWNIQKEEELKLKNKENAIINETLDNPKKEAKNKIHFTEKH